MEQERINALEILKEMKGIQNILDYVYEVVGNPMILYDVKYSLLAHTHNNIDDDLFWNEIVSTGTFSHETVDLFRIEKFIDAYANANCFTLLKSDKVKYDRANGPLYDKNGIQIGNICMIACEKPFEDDDFDFMNQVCEIVAKELENSDSSEIENAFEESIISRLIEGNQLSGVLCKNALNELYSGLKSNIFLGIIEIMYYDNSLTHLVYFKDLFKKLDNRYKYFIYLNNIVVILSSDNDKISIENELVVLNEFFEKYNIFAGFSKSFSDLTDLKKYFRQALNALNYGMEKCEDKKIFFAE